MRHDEETDRVIDELAAQLRRSGRAEARETGEAVTNGTHSFGEIAASSGYTELMEETLQALEGLTPEDFWNAAEEAEAEAATDAETAAGGPGGPAGPGGSGGPAGLGAPGGPGRPADADGSRAAGPPPGIGGAAPSDSADPAAGRPGFGPGLGRRRETAEVMPRGRAVRRPF